MRLNAAFCKAHDCPHYQKRISNGVRVCEISDKIPGNMPTCPLGLGPHVEVL